MKKFLTLFVVAAMAICNLAAAEAAADSANKEKTAAVKAAPAKKAAAKGKKNKAVRKLTPAQQLKQATTPVQYKRHAKRHEEKKAFAAANKDKIKILMLGDSITHQWEYKPAAEVQKKYGEGRYAKIYRLAIELAKEKIKIRK